MKLKDEFGLASADRIHERDAEMLSNSEFKARPLNKKIFEQIGKLPEVDKKATTHFDEFRLSQSNVKLSKKTIEEYRLNKENSYHFKARSLDKRLLEQPTFTPVIGEHKPIEQSPFKFKLDELNRQRDPSQASIDRENSIAAFKAREMPKYKFFEVKHDSHKKIEFKEFQFATQKKMETRSSSIGTKK